MCGFCNLAQRNFFISSAEVMWLLSAQHYMHAVYQAPLAQIQGTPPKREYKECKTGRWVRALKHSAFGRDWQGVALVAGLGMRGLTAAVSICTGPVQDQASQHSRVGRAEAPRPYSHRRRCCWWPLRNTFSAMKVILLWGDGHGGLLMPQWADRTLLCTHGH